MSELPEWLPVTDEQRKRADLALAQLKRDLKAAEGRPRPPYQPGKFDWPLGLDADGNYQQPDPPAPPRPVPGDSRMRGGAVTVPASRYERVLGGLLGVHAGDSLGATAEFMSWEQVRERYPAGVREIVGGGPFGWPAGHATDDTDLTRAVLLAYRDRRRGLLPPPARGPYGDPHGDPRGDLVLAAARHMAEWLNGDWPDRTPGSRPADIGGATLTGLTRFAATGDPRTSGAGPGQAGNGSLMRALPTALARTPLPGPDGQVDPNFTRMQMLLEAIQISAITHDDVNCTVACAAYTVIAAELLDGASPAEALTGLDVIPAGAFPAYQDVDGVVARAAVLSIRDLALRSSNIDLAELAEAGPDSAAGRSILVGQGRGYVLDSFAIAVAALFDPRPFPDVVIDVVRLGGDTDTNAAIAGGLLGIRDSRSAIPADWISTLQFADEFTQLADELIGRNPTDG